MGYPGHKIKEVAEITGLSTHVIRVWERRYGLFTPERAPNGYRLYSDSHIQLLLYLKAQTEAGRPIGQLAQLGTEKLKEEMAQTPVEVPDVPVALRTTADGIVNSARCEDHAQVREKIHKTVRQLGIEHAMGQVLIPVVRAIGELWHRGEVSAIGEQTITMAVRQELIEAIGQNGSDASRPLVLVACVPREFHEIAAMSAAMLLKLAGWRVVYLGPDTGIDVIQLACKRRRPKLVVLSSTMDQTSDNIHKLVDRLCSRVRPHCRVVIGGEGAKRHQELLETRGIGYSEDITTVKALRPDTVIGPSDSTLRPHARGERKLQS